VQRSLCGEWFGKLTQPSDGRDSEEFDVASGAVAEGGVPSDQLLASSEEQVARVVILEGLVSDLERQLEELRSVVELSARQTDQIAASIQDVSDPLSILNVLSTQTGESISEVLDEDPTPGEAASWSSYTAAQRAVGFSIRLSLDH
jgi:predicted ribosome quality control (RQC) complex YloA/Tae2 family protein